MDLIELNEAFATQVLACQKAFASDTFAQSHLSHLGLTHRVGDLGFSDKVNVNGGSYCPRGILWGQQDHVWF